jgi:hypothetical protein
MPKQIAQLIVYEHFCYFCTSLNGSRSNIVKEDRHIRVTILHLGQGCGEGKFWNSLSACGKREIIYTEGRMNTYTV